MRGVTAFLLVSILVAFLSENAYATRFFNKCQLARKLRTHGVDNLAAWVCLAEIHTNGKFDSLHMNPENSGYGLWEIPSKTYCRDNVHRSTESSRCNLECDAFWDENLTDDVRCFSQIFTEKGFAGFRGWNARFSVCPDMKKYLVPCGIFTG